MGVLGFLFLREGILILLHNINYLVRRESNRGGELENRLRKRIGNIVYRVESKSDEGISQLLYEGSQL